ncbi:MAG TPA: phospholipase D-like domain-containing protein [Nocardioides sp.]|uniref:phospholipase D-like domain-containing protein n=1 Tax=Nocardioides sp. TaxID=35761 RepID=UPI002ED8A5F6
MRWTAMAVSVVVLGGLGAVVPPAAPASAAATPTWMPQAGPVFNNPLGSLKGQQAILRQVLAAVRHAPRGSLIQMAVYSFDRSDLAYALRKARQRGVRVQLIVNKSVMSGVARNLQRRFGKNPNRPSFVIACPGACRRKGDGGNMHSKVFAFSQTGAAQNVVIASSGNMTSKAIYRQWNDSYTVIGDAGLYAAWQSMFSQMAHQRRVGPRRLTYTAPDGAFGAWFERSLASKGYTPGPQGTTTLTPVSGRYRPANDPVVHRIRRVGCRAPAGYGAGGRTMIRIAAYAMFQVRGEALAKALVNKKQQGCNIKIIMSVPGGPTYKRMQRAGIPMRSADWLFAHRVAEKEDGIEGWGPRFYSHYKVMMVDGMWNGRPTKTVWTGSENWSAISFANEEVVFTIHDAAVHRAYFKRWRSMWNGRATHRMGIEPTYGP